MVNSKVENMLAFMEHVETVPSLIDILDSIKRQLSSINAELNMEELNQLSEHKIEYTLEEFTGIEKDIRNLMIRTSAMRQNIKQH